MPQKCDVIPNSVRWPFTYQRNATNIVTDWRQVAMIAAQDTEARRSTMSKFLGILILSLGVASAANAFGMRPTSTHSHDTVVTSQTTPTAAPEIDPASAIGAFTLLSGGLVVLRGRRARK
jgi:hypothetical protein